VQISKGTLGVILVELHRSLNNDKSVEDTLLWLYDQWQYWWTRVSSKEDVDGIDIKEVHDRFAALKDIATSPIKQKPIHSMNNTHSLSIFDADTPLPCRRGSGAAYQTSRDPQGDDSFGDQLYCCARDFGQGDSFYSP